MLFFLTSLDFSFKVEQMLPSFQHIRNICRQDIDFLNTFFVFLGNILLNFCHSLIHQLLNNFWKTVLNLSNDCICVAFWQTLHIFYERS